MPYKKVLGSTQLFSIDVLNGTAYDLVMCLTNQSIGITNDEIDAATKCGPDTSIGKQKSNVSFEGEIIITPTVDTIGAAILWGLVQNKTLFSWKYGPATAVTGDIVRFASGYLSEYTESAPTDGNVTFSCKVAVSGTITQTVTA